MPQSEESGLGSPHSIPELRANSASILSRSTTMKMIWEFKSEHCTGKLKQCVTMNTLGKYVILKTQFRISLNYLYIYIYRQVSTKSLKATLEMTTAANWQLRCGPQDTWLEGFTRAGSNQTRLNNAHWIWLNSFAPEPQKHHTSNTSALLHLFGCPAPPPSVRYGLQQHQTINFLVRFALQVVWDNCWTCRKE